jgi:hypothetical protein
VVAIKLIFSHAVRRAITGNPVTRERKKALRTSIIRVTYSQAGNAGNGQGNTHMNVLHALVPRDRLFGDILRATTWRSLLRRPSSIHRDCAAAIRAGGPLQSIGKKYEMAT